jgi:hypothetical protein
MVEPLNSLGGEATHRATEAAATQAGLPPPPLRRLLLVPGGNHRLSRPGDLALMAGAVDDVARAARAGDGDGESVG